MLVNGNTDLYNRETEEYIVAYIDLLGIKSEMNKGNKEQQLAMNKLYNLYTHSIDTTRMIAWEENKEINFKIFSDNILISRKLSKDNDKRKLEVKTLIYCVAHFQALAASDSVGWLLRGGIAIGQLFVDDIMVWGQALLKTYDLESNIAIYPRIVLDSTVVNEVQKNDELSDFIRKDFDGVYFLNYLSMCHFYGEMLSSGFEMIQENNLLYRNERIYQKLYWHMEFINRELDRKNEQKDKKYRLKFSPDYLIK
ncbi:hypothetical protein MHB40_20150 [Lysinibacillus sp. FSL K6-0057]|uniref:hypothetical protein n=1 Tax=Lysinibacillus sp. FSL K6-0057 TaxID=2921411 RepID=UPI00315A4477